MGQWFARFLSSQGYEVEIADISGPVPGYAFRSDWQSPVPKHDLIVVATSLAMTAEVLDKLEQINPTGVVMEIASLKTPHRDSLNRLARAGIRTASIHPMFGPSTTMLSGRHVICIDLGEHSAHGNGAELFSSTMANCVTMTLDEHDKLMATVLGMSHALNIAFFTALERSGSAIPELDRISSTTFDAQLKVSTAVSEESPNLYFEIQSLNTYGLEALEHLETAIRDVRLAIENTDRETFTALMERGREYLNARSASNRT
jgi:chorismate mutase/prephenate dehydrogenase